MNDNENGTAALPGLWVAGLPLFPTARFKVRSLAASGFSEEVTRRGMLIPATKLVALGKAGLSRELLAIAIDCVLDLLLVGWENVTIDGETIPFDRKAAREALDADSALRACIISAAGRIDDESWPGYVASGLA